MSDTITDMAKVTQMLDAGWQVRIRKCDLGSYYAQATHEKQFLISRANRRIIESAPPESRDTIRFIIDKRYIGTDDFTPQQALTRLAYKVHGEII